MFAQLHLHSHLGSRLDAIGSSKQYAEKAYKLGHKALAITDHGKLTGIYHHQEACKEYGIKPILGVEAYINDELVEYNEKKKRVRGKNSHLILLAKNEIGYKNILKLNYLSMKDEEHFYYTNRITEEELFENSEGIIVGSGCMQSKWGRFIRAGEIDKAYELFQKYVKHFGENFYTEVQFNEINYEMDEAPEGQKTINDYMIKWAKEFNIPIVVTGDVHYLEPGQDNLQTLSIAIRDKATIDNLNFEIESKNLYYHDEEDYLKFNKDFGYNYNPNDVIEWANNSIKIADMCNYEIPERRKIYLPSVTENDDEALIKKAKRGLEEKFGGNPTEEYKKRLNHELEVLIRKGFSSYILILEDMLEFVTDSGYTVGVGRGSGAGSLVLYSLNITRLDPIEFGLLFERFLSDQRSPDMIPDYFGDEVHTKEMETKMTDLKKMCEDKLEEYPEYKRDFKWEYLFAKNFYKNGIDLYKAFQENEVKGNFLIPFLLGFTNTYEQKLTKAQVRNGASGGIDVDSDLSPSARDHLIEHLKEKYGEDRVFQVGTYSKMGLKSALKDLLRIYKIDYKASNEFSKIFDFQLSLDENIEMIKATHTKQYKFYEQNKKIIDLVRHFDGKVRQLSKHAGGIIILDRPVNELMPIEKVSGEIVSAFPESNQDSVLDELGIIKFDVLGLTTLDVINNTLNKIDEKIYLIEDDDGLKKIVPQSYIDDILEAV